MKDEQLIKQIKDHAAEFCLDNRRVMTCQVEIESAMLIGAALATGHSNLMDDHFDNNHKLNSINLSWKLLGELTDPKQSEAETVLRAWQEAFGTTQLTHALARLEAAEKKAKGI